MKTSYSLIWSDINTVAKEFFLSVYFHCSFSSFRQQIFFSPDHFNIHFPDFYFWILYFFYPPYITKSPQLSFTHQNCSVYHPSSITFSWPYSSASQHKAWPRLSKVHCWCQEPTGRWEMLWNSLLHHLQAPTAPGIWGTVGVELCPRVSCECGLLFSKEKQSQCFTHPPCWTAGLAPHSLCSCLQRSQDSKDQLWATAGSHHLHFTLSKRLHFSLLPILHDKFLKLGFW